jgi:DNA-binding protein YbaB
VTGGLADSLIARIARQRDLIQAMDQHCKSMSVRVTSRCKSVSVEVDGLGAMTGLWLGESAYHKGANALAKLIIDTAHAAAKQVVDRQSYLIKEFTERLTTLQQAPLTRRDGTTFPDSTGCADPMSSDYCPDCEMPCPACQPAAGPGQPCEECLGAGRIPRG